MAESQPAKTMGPQASPWGIVEMLLRALLHAVLGVMPLGRLFVRAVRIR